MSRQRWEVTYEIHIVHLIILHFKYIDGGLDNVLQRRQNVFDLVNLSSTHLIFRPEKGMISAMARAWHPVQIRWEGEGQALGHRQGASPRYRTLPRQLEDFFGTLFAKLVDLRGRWGLLSGFELDGVVIVEFWAMTEKWGVFEWRSSKVPCFGSALSLLDLSQACLDDYPKKPAVTRNSWRGEILADLESDGC